MHIFGREKLIREFKINYNETKDKRMQKLPTKVWWRNINKFCKGKFYLWQDWYYSNKNTLNEIRVGYTNLVLYKLGAFTPECVKPYEEKLNICKGCPIFGKRFGLNVCDSRKEYKGVNGCGCVSAAKLWSNSPCPRELF